MSVLQQLLVFGLFSSSLFLHLLLASAQVQQTEGVPSTGGDAPSSDLKESVFLEEIFKRYGGREGISFEGLEHLLANLGLGGLQFEKSHNVSVHRTQDGDFKEIHDSQSLHTHNHSLVKRAFRDEERCLSPQELLKFYGLRTGHGVIITRSEFLPMCPAIVHQLDRRLCSPRAVFNQAPDLGLKAWIFALSSVALMTLVGLLGVVIVPLLDKAIFNKLLSFLGALAVGTLAGDALLHLLPHALQAHPDGRVVISRAGCAFLTLLFFFTVEAVVSSRGKKKSSQKDFRNKDGESSYSMVMDHGHSHGGGSSSDQSNVIWMVITGDGLHNFTDGLAMGAAFRQDVITGIATALAVLTHELPHELGDFALLLQNGMTIRRAVVYNLVSSILSFLGVIVGLFLANYSEAALWVYSGTAGSFLYIALSTLIPQMQKQVTSLSHLLIQLSGMFLGGVLMFVIAIYEHAFHDFLKEEFD